MKKIYVPIIIIAIIIFGLFIYSLFSNPGLFITGPGGRLDHNITPVSSIKSPDLCDISNPDPDGYLLKICKYLNDHNNTIYPNKEPNDYTIKTIKNGTYSRSGFSYDVLVVRLDCCGTGDLAYIDINTKEVIGFSPGDR